MTQTCEAPATTLVTDDDVINHLAGIGHAAGLGALRAQRPEVVRYAEGSYRALFEPADLGNVSRVDRYLIALRVGVLTSSAALISWHQTRLRYAGLAEEVLATAAENPTADVLSPRIQAILHHVDRLTTAPATATKAHIAELTAVGLTARDIVVISQLIAFLSFQVRTLVGLRILAEGK